MSERNWTQYYKAISGRSPRPLLGEAIEYIPPHARILELGAGDFVESVFLLDSGHSVDAIDSAEGSKKLAQMIHNPNFSFEHTTYSDYNFKANTYDMVLALFSLPFHGKKDFNELFTNIKTSLKSKGVFCGNLFGIHDEWNTSDSDLIFHSKEEVASLLNDLEILKLAEVETDGKTAAGATKHWHTFQIIARKI